MFVKKILGNLCLIGFALISPKSAASDATECYLFGPGCYFGGTLTVNGKCFNVNKIPKDYEGISYEFGVLKYKHNGLWYALDKISEESDFSVQTLKNLHKQKNTEYQIDKKTQKQTETGKLFKEIFNVYLKRENFTNTGRIDKVKKLMSEKDPIKFTLTYIDIILTISFEEFKDINYSKIYSFFIDTTNSFLAKGKLGYIKIAENIKNTLRKILSTYVTTGDDQLMYNNLIKINENLLSIKETLQELQERNLNF